MYYLFKRIAFIIIFFINIYKYIQMNIHLEAFVRKTAKKSAEIPKAAV